MDIVGSDQSAKIFKRVVTSCLWANTDSDVLFDAIDVNIHNILIYFEICQYLLPKILVDFKIYQYLLQ